MTGQTAVRAMKLAMKIVRASSALQFFFCLGLLSTLVTAPALAQSVTARSGEHDGFTRIVLDFGAPVDWTVGRTLDGYALRLPDRQAVYDLSSVFDRIGKGRLGAIWTDPESGDLVFSANCPCHAIAFEFRPGTVVIDLKDGAPPKNSGFETALSGAEGSVSTSDSRVFPKPRSGQETSAAAGELSDPMPVFDWTRTSQLSADLAEPVETAASDPNPPIADREAVAATKPAAVYPEKALAEFEENLLAELAGAASSGILDLAKPEASGDAAPQPDDEVLEQLRIGRSELAGLGKATSRQKGLGADGDKCASKEDLAIDAWGDPERPVADQIAEMRSDLVGEFDAVDPERVKTTIRFHLYLGFGTEVQDMLQAFEVSSEDRPLWTAMAHVLEGEPEIDGLFSPMLACRGPAALWALLANGLVNGENPGVGFDRQPVLLAFSELPVHLRRHLGPRLVERFLSMGDSEGARILSDAIFRPGATEGQGLDLMKARISLDGGNATETEAILRERISAGGADQTKAYFALVELMAQQRKPISPEDTLAIEALSAEQPDEVAAARVLALAQAASGDFASAFTQNSGFDGLSSDVWGLLANLGTDDDLLNFAVLGQDAKPGSVQPGEAIKIAERLLDLGLPAQSRRWQDWANQAQLVPNAADPATRLLAARSQLALGMGRDALVNLEGSDQQDETTRELVYQAYGAAGDDSGLARILDPADPRRAAALGRAGDWNGLAEADDGPWSVLAKELSGIDTNAPGETIGSADRPLERSTRLLQTSAGTRDLIQSLLTSTSLPEG